MMALDWFSLIESVCTRLRFTCSEFIRRHPRHSYRVEYVGCRPQGLARLRIQAVGSRRRGPMVDGTGMKTFPGMAPTQPAGHAVHFRRGRAIAC
jgi:hypothetical protein